MGNKLKSSGKYGTQTLKFANHIGNQSVWDALQHRPSDRVFSRCGVVKFVVDLHSDPDKPVVYLLQSRVRSQEINEHIQNKEKSKVLTRKVSIRFLALLL